MFIMFFNIGQLNCIIFGKTKSTSKKMSHGYVTFLQILCNNFGVRPNIRTTVRINIKTCLKASIKTSVRISKKTYIKTNVRMMKLKIE